MKKLIALIAAIAVMMSMTVVSFAAFEDEITLNADGKYTAALPEAAATANAGKQTTIVAYKGDTIAVGSIQYINQDAQTSFDFLLKDALTEDVKVVMGGENILKQEIGTIKYVEEATAFTVSGTVANYMDQDFIDEDLIPYVEEVFEGDEEAIAEYSAAYIAGYATYARLYDKAAWFESVAEEYLAAYEGGEAAPEAIANATIDTVAGTYALENIEAGEYVLVIDRLGALPYLKYVTVADANVEVDEITLALGDAAADYSVDFSDISYVFSNMADLGTDEFFTSNDANSDLCVDFGDISYIFGNMTDIWSYGEDAIDETIE